MNSTNTLRIRNEATLTSYGIHRNGNAKPVIAVDLDMAFNSLTDLAEYCNVSANAVSNAINKDNRTVGMYRVDANGQRVRVGKTHVKIASEAETVIDAIMKSSRNAKSQLAKVNAENAELAKKAALWDEYQKELEKQRKEEEKKNARLEKARKKKERKERIFNRLKEEMAMAMAEYQNAERELAELEASA